MAQLGNERRVYIVTGTSSLTYTWLTGEQTNSYNRTAEAIETSDKSTVWAQFLTGKLGATLEVTVYVDDTNAQQKAVLQALHNGATVRVFVGVITGTGSSQSLAGELIEAVITAISDTNDNGSVSTRNISLTASGAPMVAEPDVQPA